MIPTLPPKIDLREMIIQVYLLDKSQDFYRFLAGLVQANGL
jgi:hypothetical protein